MALDSLMLVAAMRTNERLAEWVNTILSRHGDLSLRQARIRTGIDIDTLSRMKQGDRVRMDKIILFAQGFGEDPNEGLVRGGYQPVIADRRAEYCCMGVPFESRAYITDALDRMEERYGPDQPRPGWQTALPPRGLSREECDDILREIEQAIIDGWNRIGRPLPDGDSVTGV